AIPRPGRPRAPPGRCGGCPRRRVSASAWGLVEPDQVPARVGDRGDGAEVLPPDGLDDARAASLELREGLLEVADEERDLDPGMSPGAFVERQGAALADGELGPAAFDVQRL